MEKPSLTEEFIRDLQAEAIVTEGKLLSFRDLAQRYSCSPATIKRTVDKLEKQGLLCTVHGRGTFLVNDDHPALPKKQMLIGAIVLHDFSEIELNLAKEDYLKKGWIFSIYDASLDNQSPEREKQFLKLVQEQQFQAVIMEATPLAPVNTDLFQRLRCDGTKVIHLSPYVEDMENETYFLPDYYATGQLAVVQLALRHYDSFIFPHLPSEAPFIQQVHQGIRMMARQLNIPEMPFSAELPRADLITSLIKDNKRTAILETSIHIASDWMATARELHVDVPGQLGVISCTWNSNDTQKISNFTFDYHSIISDALDYATSRSVNPLKPVHRKYEPILQDLHTL